MPPIYSDSDSSMMPPPDRYSLLCEEFPLLSFNLLPKHDVAGEEDPNNDNKIIDLVLRHPLRRAEFGETLQELRRLGDHPDAQATIRSVFLYKDYMTRLSTGEQNELYATLGNALGAQLTEFSLSFVKLSITSLAMMLRSMPQLETLHLGRVSLLQRADAVQLYAALMKLQNLREFHWSLMTAPAEEAPLFQLLLLDNNNQQQQQPQQTSMDPLLMSLAQLPHLETVYLAAHRPGGGRIQTTLALQALSKSNVSDLTLVNCPLEQNQVRALLTCKSRSFTSLALLHAEIGDRGAQIIVQQGLLRLPEEAGNKRLQKLYLPGNGLTDVSGIAIALALRHANSSLEVLDIHDNRLTSAFGNAMGKTLQQTQSSLSFLDVSYNPLGDAGGIALAAALTHNTTLSTLNMFQNQITDHTCAALAKALLSNRRLKQVNLYNNPRVSARGVQSLLQHLEETNYVLERLEVSPLQEEQDDDARRTEEALEFVLTLNRNYRRHQLLSGERENETQYLEKGILKAMAQDDLNSLFYFLKMKPTLCQQQQQQQQQPRRMSCSKEAIAQMALEACVIAGESL